MSSWIERLEVLRTIDSVIDFSRATAQLRILIALDERSLTVTELVDATGLRRKTILDALRKLELKGLVGREGDKFYLTDKGRYIYNALKSIVIGADVAELHRKIETISYKPSLYDVYNELISVVYMLQALKLLGQAKNHSLPLAKLASKLCISPHTLDNHLQRFTHEPIQLFVKYREDDRTYYRLTDLGLDLYRKLFQQRSGILGALIRNLRKLFRKK